ncbi:hypothetical protein HOLleu_37187 [Holothuria leucospilota]|uniref:Calx-beta domain-containing protein n=1 Tax=Holothuria leucospilota TaxID=206669 RepID=A0A9Q1BEB9_HOLLE|nr:hypothetical protein HOLleu_37187 [Holothuria leucospilota]
MTMIAIPTLTSDFSFSVPIVNNEVVEDFESFCVELDNVLLPSTFLRSEGTDFVDSTSVVTIQDDDTDVLYDDGDAFNPGDYRISVTTVAIPAGSFTFEIPVEIVDDSLIESDEYFQIVLTNVNEDAGFARSQAAVLGLTSGTISIKDIDSGIYTNGHNDS